MAANILAVDDNPTNLKLLCEILESDGYEVTRAVDGYAALASIEQSKPDLILMDIAMPGIDGLTLTRQLKADPATSHIPIIIVTASAMKGDSGRAVESGCDDYITKPLDIALLRKKLTQFLAPLP